MNSQQHLETTQLGTVPIEPQNILCFPQGIPGFEDCQQWHLFHEEKETQPIVYWLQSLDHPDILLNITHPANADLEYTIVLTEDEKKILGYKPQHELGVLLILSRSEKTNAIRALTDAPLVINLDTLCGLQKVGLVYHLLDQTS